MSGQIFPKMTVGDLDLFGQTVLVRADYNVPLDGNGEVVDDFRITASIPTLQFLLERKCKIVIISHLGRPKGRPDKTLSLAPVATILADRLGQDVAFVGDCIGDEVKILTKKMVNGEVVLLENLRFHAGEEKNDVAFARDLAVSSNAHFFVQDGFGVVHRAHASTSAITQFLPSVGGILLAREWEEIENVVTNPKRPLIAILGGAKVSDKIELIEKLIDLADGIIIGGAMANNFLAFEGYNVGTSLIEPDMRDIVKKIYSKAKKKFATDFNDKFQIPVDVAVSEHGLRSGPRVEVDPGSVGKTMKILDIGATSIERAGSLIKTAKTVIWNGPLGVSELKQFSYGSARVALALAARSDVTSIIGGGDTADFVRKWQGEAARKMPGTVPAKVRGQRNTIETDSPKVFTWISTGGGASLELMAGEPMPGIDALMDTRGGYCALN